MKAIVIVSHGSRWNDVSFELKNIKEEIKRKFNSKCLIEYAFLEFCNPSIEEILEILVEKGCKKVILLPYFLSYGKHLKKDIPEIVKRFNSKMEITIADPIGTHPKIIEILIDRINETEKL